MKSDNVVWLKKIYYSYICKLKKGKGKIYYNVASYKLLRNISEFYKFLAQGWSARSEMGLGV